jgi:hypothetical protein
LLEGSISAASGWVTIFTGPLAVVGIALAWSQLRRTANAAEATQTAVERTARGMALYQLLILIPEMQQYEAALDAAVHAPDENRAIEILSSWRKTGTEVHGLLDSRPRKNPQLAVLLQESFVDAYTAKSDLLAGTSDLLHATAKVRETVGKVTVLLGLLSGQLRANIGGEAT